MIDLNRRVGDRRLGHHALAAGAQHVDLRRLLVGGEVALEEEALDVGVLLEDPVAGGLGRLAGHVLAGGVAGRVVEARVEDAARRVLLDVLEAARLRRRLGDLADLVEVLVQPLAERARAAGALEQERRRALHAVVHDRRLHAAGGVQQLHAAVVGGHQRALRGRHRDVELALRVLAVDEQRPGDPERHLGDPGEVLDVAGQDRRVERVGADVLEAGAHLLARGSRGGPRRPRGCSRRTGGGRRRGRAAWWRPCGGLPRARRLLHMHAVGPALPARRPAGRGERGARASRRAATSSGAGRAGRPALAKAARTSGPATVQVTSRAPAGVVGDVDPAEPRDVGIAGRGQVAGGAEARVRAGLRHAGAVGDPRHQRVAATGRASRSSGPPRRLGGRAGRAAARGGSAAPAGRAATS